MISDNAHPASRDTAAGFRQPKQGRSRATVERILHAADQEIGEVGLVRATTTSIAQRAGVSVGALYRFFRDKDELAEALAQRYLEEVSEAYGKVLGEMSDVHDVRAAVLDLVDVAAAAHLKNPGYYRLTEDTDPQEDSSPAHVVRENVVALFVSRLREGISDEPEEALREVVTLCVESVRHTLAHAPNQPEARELRIRELKAMVGAYVSARFATT